MSNFMNKQEVESLRLKYPKGIKIKILYMDGEPHYSGRIGIITHIDDIGQIHGTWGGCAIISTIDKFEVVK